MYQLIYVAFTCFRLQQTLWKQTALALKDSEWLTQIHASAKVGVVSVLYSSWSDKSIGLRTCSSPVCEMPVEFFLMYITRLFHSLTDIDECTFSNGGCGHTCNNTLGGYECICHHGFELAADDYTCKGTDSWFCSWKSHGMDSLTCN